jgi:hypothetical protein
LLGFGEQQRLQRLAFFSYDHGSCSTQWLSHEYHSAAVTSLGWLHNTSSVLKLRHRHRPAS